MIVHMLLRDLKTSVWICSHLNFFEIIIENVEFISRGEFSSYLILVASVCEQFNPSTKTIQLYSVFNCVVLKN